MSSAERIYAAPMRRGRPLAAVSAVWLPMTNFAPTQRAALDPTPYMDTLEASLGDEMTGNTRPAPLSPFGHTKDGDEIEVRRSGFAVDIDTTSSGPHEMELRPYIPRGCDQQGRHPDGRRAMTHAEIAADAAAAREAGARMGGGLAQQSEPMPLQVHERTPQHYWSRVADLVVLALAAGFVLWTVFR